MKANGKTICATVMAYGDMKTAMRWNVNGNAEVKTDVEDNFPVSDYITSGETKKYSYCKECTATIYDEDYDYTIEREMMIECG